MTTRTVIGKSLLALGVVAALCATHWNTSAIAGSPATGQQPQAANLNAVSGLVGGLYRLGSYVGDVGTEMTSVSKEEVTVSKQYRCLAQAIYFEARGEPVAGQRAVAHVVLNRVHDRRYPNTVCGVVFQNQHLHNRCQFSFACDGTPNEPRNARAWQRSLQVALEVLSGASEDATYASTHYHATYAPYLRHTVQVGAHLFYQEPFPGERYLVSATAD